MENLYSFALVTLNLIVLSKSFLKCDLCMPLQLAAADYQSFHRNHNKHVLGGKKKVFCLIWGKRNIHEIQQTMHLCVVKSHRISSFIRYSKLRHLHRKLTSFEHIIHGGKICIKVPGIYSYANVFSVLSVKWALIQSQIQCTVYISH